MERLSWHRTCERLGGDVILKIVAADALKRTPYLITRSCSAFLLSSDCFSPRVNSSHRPLSHSTTPQLWLSALVRFPIC